MANTRLIDKTDVTSLSSSDKVIVNSGSKIRQITLGNLNNSLAVINERALAQVAFYTDFDEAGNVILGQGGNMAIADYIWSRGGNYLLNSSGYAAKLMPNDPTKFLDGTTAPLDGSKGNEMTLLPDYYYLVGANPNGGVRFWVGLTDLGGHYQPEQWIGTHKAYVTGGKMLSRSGVVPTGSLTISAFNSAARVNGAQFGLANYNMRKTLALMFFTKYGTTQSQDSKILGNGLSGVNSSYNYCRNIPTGKANMLGDGTGYVTVNDSEGNAVGSTSVFGVKDPFGQVWEFCGGVASYGSTFYISNDNVDPVEGVPSWSNMRQQIKITTGSGSYIAKMQWGEYADMLPKVLGGTSTSHYTDGYYTADSGRVLLWGGAASLGALCGLVCAGANYVFSDASAGIGARLGFFSTANVVSGTKYLTL